MKPYNKRMSKIKKIIKSLENQIAKKIKKIKELEKEYSYKQGRTPQSDKKNPVIMLQIEENLEEKNLNSLRNYLNIERKNEIQNIKKLKLRKSLKGKLYKVESIN